MDLFEKFEKETFSVFSDKSMLNLDYLPSILVARRGEEEYFGRIFVNGVRDNYLPPVIRVTGPPGSGKTVTVVSVCDKFQSYKPDFFGFRYVNLKGSRTVFMAGNAVLAGISGRKVAPNLGLDALFDEIWKELGSSGRKPFFCLILDELESVFLDKHYDPSDFFYRLIRYKNYVSSDLKLCLILISNELDTVENNLDARVRSSMGDEAIYFKPYSLDQLKDIMQNRIDMAFKENVFTKKAEDSLEYYLQGEFGDARKAITFLRRCGELANERKSKITVEICNKIYNKLEDIDSPDFLDNLQTTQIYILRQIAILLRYGGTITTGDLYRFHDISIRRMGEDPQKVVSQRTILSSIKYFESLGIITTWNVSKGRRGYGKNIRLNMDPENLLMAIGDLI